MGFLNTEKAIIGFDLHNNFSQISYSFSESDGVETLSQVAGAEDYNIPTVLCKRQGINQWYIGREAIRYSEEQQGILVENLLALALDGEPILIDGEEFDPVALLTLFIKRCLGMLSHEVPADKIGALMITCENIDYNMLEILDRVVTGLRLKTDKIAFQSHTESYYSYLIQQPVELWIPQSVLFFYNDNCMMVYRMECNRKTKPMVAFIEERSYPFREWEELAATDLMYDKRNQELDRAFLEIATEVCDGKLIGSAFLIGDGFRQEWMKESLRYLCRNRRVFQGSNLFSKGACLGMRERIEKTSTDKEYVFLGNDKLKANIGFRVYRQGQENYFALMDAGVNWYEAERELEFYIQDGNEIEFLITPLNGRNKRMVKMTLEGFKQPLSRIKLWLKMESEKTMRIDVMNLGLGELLPAEEQTWSQQIELY